MCQKHVSFLLTASSPGGAGLGPVYLDGGHLCISAPTEALKLQRVVAEAHSPAVRRGPFLQLKFQVVKVREIMIPHRSGEEKEHRDFYQQGKALDSPSSPPSPFRLLSC